MKKFIVTLLFVPEAVHAEVMDKEPSLYVIWILAFISGALLFAVARYRPWLLFVVVPLVTLIFFGQLSELADPSVRLAMSREAGSIYIVSSWVAPVVPVVGAIIGWWLRYRGTAAQQGAPGDAIKRRA